MISKTTERFRRAFQQLPQHIQQQARAAYQLFRNDPAHPSLRFKPVHPSKPIFSVRVGRDYRAIAVRGGERVDLVLDRESCGVRPFAEAALADSHRDQERDIPSGNEGSATSRKY